MDVDHTSFYPLLLDILTDISEAHFVAIDLELSGVCSKEPWGKGSGRPTLQERYLETKEAAERYQILQIGLTCVQQNIGDANYLLKPYNFDICPIIRERGLDVERIFSFQSGAVEFLLGVGFDMNKPFSKGVPYLSRAESKIARDKYAMRQDRSALADIKLKPTEVESLAFLERVRQEINAWNDNKSQGAPHYINITPIGSEPLPNGERSMEELSRFEKRLVHQLVRAEYPELVSVSRKGFIQIVKYDREREEKVAANRKLEMEERISRQKGFRWIIEALHGGNVSGLNLKECAKDPSTGGPMFVDMDSYKAQFNRAQALLRNNPKVIVGHNCFLDMVYIYRHFVGDLPDTVEEFQQKLHRLWPVVVDTKYMSTHNCGDINPVSSLEQIASQLSDQETPLVLTDSMHHKYNVVRAYHEAGYDSYLTAQVAVRLSAKLDREGAYVDENLQSSELDRVTLEDDTPDNHTETQKIDNHSNADATGFVPSVVGAKWKRKGDKSLGPVDKHDPFLYNPQDLKHHHKIVDVTMPGGMPRFGSEFWRIYGNKLRVFGTQEGVCVLDSSAESPVSEEDGGVGL